MLRLHKLVLVLTAVVALNALLDGEVSAQGIGYITNPGKLIDDARKRIGDGSKGPIIRHMPDEPTSGVAVLSPPSIDSRGRIWSGSSSGGSAGNVVGQASLRHNSSGQAWWVSSYSNRYGRVQPRRAPAYDRSYRTRIDENTGVVWRETYVGSRRVGRTQVGRATLVYDRNGRPLYRYNGRLVSANKPWRPQQPVRPPQPSTSQYPNHNQQQGDPGLAIAGGILQIIAAAAQQGQR